MQFERRISTYLPKVIDFSEFFYDYWIEFEAIVNGKPEHGWAQPDMWGVYQDMVLLPEVKLSQNNLAIPQLLKLYVPLLSKIYPPECIIPVHVFKNIRSKDSTLDHITDAFRAPKYMRKQVQLYQHIH